ncbi:MaoC/PaaZ C-terminal domain-containing protein [Chloroflexota bacterium]
MTTDTLLYYEDIIEGMALPEIVKRPSTRQLVKWAAATEDMYEAHYDKDFAEGLGLPAVLVQGRLKAAYLGQLVCGWARAGGRLKKLSCRYLTVDFPGNIITCRGTVIRKYRENDEYFAECSVWAENDRGEKTISGEAIVQLPTRGEL